MGFSAPARAPTPPPADPNPPARPPIEAGEKKALKARFPVGTFESIAKDPKNRKSYGAIYADGYATDFSDLRQSPRQLQQQGEQGPGTLSSKGVHLRPEPKDVGRHRHKVQQGRYNFSPCVCGHIR